MRTRLGEQFGSITELTIALNGFFRDVLMASDREMQEIFTLCSHHATSGHEFDILTK